MFTLLLYDQESFVCVCMCVWTDDQGSLEKDPKYISIHLNYGMV